MRNIRAIIIAAAMAGYGSAAVAGDYVPRQADFRLAFPGEIQVAADASTANDPDEAQFRRYVSDRDGDHFELTIDRYPAGIRAPAPTRAIYERLLWAHVQEGGGTLSDARPATLSSIPCYQATFTRPNGQVEVRRVLMLGDSVYQLSYAGARVPEAAANEFFGSFRLTASSLSAARNGDVPAI